jgi:cyclopropane-fatty-acyl-phospholipid synthase
MNSLLNSYLKRSIRAGTLEVIDSAGKSHSFGDGTGDPVRVRFASASAERNVILNPDLKLGEEFVTGGYTVEVGTLYDFVMLVFTNAKDMLPPWPTIGLMGFRYLTKHIRQFNTPARARRNVHAHYDLDGHLYSLFLDEDRQYSCAYFEDGVTTLEEAQLAKKRHLAAKLAVKPGQRVLDIGSGWGGLGMYLAEYCGAEVVGVTLSDEQYAESNGRAKERGLDKNVRFLLQDYRNVEGPFDRIVSVGMFEHVGLTHYRRFFKSCRNLLTDDGVMVLHTIGRAGRPGDTSAWIQKYIFPGGYIPAMSEVIPAIEKSKLMLTDVEILRLHYAMTLRLWRERFLARRDEVKALYDERFCRMWEFYLAVSEMAFRVGGMVNFQIQLAKHHETLPLTRDYMRAAEDALRAADSEPARRPPLRIAGE